MNPAAWVAFCEALPPEISLSELAEELDDDPTLTEDDRAAMWLYAWSRPEPDAGLSASRFRRRN